MIDEDMLKEALDYTITDSHHHKEEYDNAPSKACREYLELSYFCSYYSKRIIHNKELDNAYREECALTEKRMSLEDWEYLLKYAPPKPIRGYYLKKIKELKAKEQEPGTE